MGNMKKSIFILLSLLMGMNGCQSKTTSINYEGKSKNWDITYKINGNKEYHDSYFSFTYIGNDKRPDSEIRYIIDGPKEGEGGKFSLNSTNEYNGKMTMTGGLPSDSDRGIKVKIEWDGKTELTLLPRAD